MPDISIIIFALALIAIMVMMIRQYQKIKARGELEKDFPRKDFSEESFYSLQKKAWRMWLIFSHGVAIIATRAWVRVSHYISTFFRKGLRKIENRMIKLEKRNSESGTPKQSIFLTTMKTYKHEIRKLKGRAEEELPRPREEFANLEKSDNIDESKPE